jgi:hypothetical protein
VAEQLSLAKGTGVLQEKRGNALYCAYSIDSHFRNELWWAIIASERYTDADIDTSTYCYCRSDAHRHSNVYPDAETNDTTSSDADPYVSPLSLRFPAWRSTCFSGRN